MKQLACAMIASVVFLPIIAMAAPPSAPPGIPPHPARLLRMPDAALQRAATRTFEISPTRTIQGHSGAVGGLAISHDDKLIASLAADKSLRIWDLQSGREIRKIAWPGVAGEMQLSFSPDDAMLAVAGFQHNIMVWDVKTGELLAELEGHSQGLVGVAFLPGGKQLISCSLDQTIRLWDINKEKQIDAIDTPAGCRTGLSVSADGKTVACAGTDGTIMVFDIQSHRLLAQIKPEINWAASTPALSPKGDRVIAAWYRNWFREYEVDTGKMLREWQVDAHSSPHVDGIAETSDGKLAFALSPSGFDVVRPGQDGVLAKLSNVAWQLRCGAISQDGRYAVAAGGIEPSEGSNLAPDYSIYVWNVGADKQASLGSPLRALAASADETAAASLAADGTITLWDPATLTPVRKFAGSKSAQRLALDGAGKKILTAADEGSLQLWDVATGKHRDFSLPAPVGPITFINPRVAAAAFGKNIQLIDLDALAPIPDGQFTGHSATVTALAASSNGQLVVSASKDKSVRLWDVAAKRELRQFPRPDPDMPTAVRFSPDAGRIYCVDPHYYAVVYDTQTAQVVRQFFTVKNPDPADIIVSLDGTLAIVFGGRSGQANLWSVQDGSHIRDIGSGVRPLEKAVVARGMLIGGSSDGTIVAYRLAGDNNLFPRQANSFLPIHPLCIGPDGTTGLAEGEASLDLWDLANRKIIQHFGKGVVNRVAVSLDGSRVAVSCFQDVQVWQTSTGRKIYESPARNENVGAVALSPDAKILAFSVETQPRRGQQTQTLVRICEAGTGKLLHELSGHTTLVKGLQFSPDGKRLLTRSGSDEVIITNGKKETFDNSVRLWDVSSGKLLWEHPSDSPFGDQVFLPGGKEFLLAEASGELHVYDAETFEEKRTGHTAVSSGVRQVVPSRDGKRLLIVPRVDAARIVDCQTLRETGALSLGQAWGRAGGFLLDGRAAVWVNDGSSPRLIAEEKRP